MIYFASHSIILEIHVQVPYSRPIQPYLKATFSQLISLIYFFFKIANLSYLLYRKHNSWFYCVISNSRKCWGLVKWFCFKNAWNYSRSFSHYLSPDMLNFLTADSITGPFFLCIIFFINLILWWTDSTRYTYSYL